ncbi:MAG: nucleoside deaminase [Lentisphaerae bacterium]|nr:nucleoside deaminase [Lentisphaerota bacterium]
MNMINVSDEHFMRIALRQANAAIGAGDVPVGAVITHNGQLIAQAHNQVELLKDPTAHAEMIAITQAASAIGDWRLLETTLYVTKEPCRMCSGAITHARIPRVVFGAKDPDNAGPLPAAKEVIQGLMEEECKEILVNFFRELRKKAQE